MADDTRDLEGNASTRRHVQTAEDQESGRSKPRDWTWEEGVPA
jgi:hypothetical protein